MQWVGFQGTEKNVNTSSSSLQVIQLHVMLHQGVQQPTACSGCCCHPICPHHLSVVTVYTSYIIPVLYTVYITSYDVIRIYRSTTINCSTTLMSTRRYRLVFTMQQQYCCFTARSKSVVLLYCCCCCCSCNKQE